MTREDPTLYDLVRYLDRRLAKAIAIKQACEARGDKPTGMALEVIPLDVALTALAPLVADEIESMYGGC